MSALIIPSLGLTLRRLVSIGADSGQSLEICVDLLLDGDPLLVSGGLELCELSNSSVNETRSELPRPNLARKLSDFSSFKPISPDVIPGDAMPLTPSCKWWPSPFGNPNFSRDESAWFELSNLVGEAELLRVPVLGVFGVVGAVSNLSGDERLCIYSSSLGSIGVNRVRTLRLEGLNGETVRSIE